MMQFTEVVAFCAGLCTTGSAIPQVYLVYKSKSSKDISYASVVVVVIGTALWLTYGAILHLYLLVVWNVLSFVLGCILLGIKIHHGRLTALSSCDIEATKLIDQQESPQPSLSIVTC